MYCKIWAYSVVIFLIDLVHSIHDAREVAMSKMIEASQRMITMKTMNIQGVGINPYYKEAFGIRNKDAPKCVYRCG